MARPTKSITTRTGHMSKNEIDTRQEYEAKLRGESDRIRPPSFLSKDQKRIFKGIVDYLIPSGILGNIDIHVVTHAAITIDRINECERQLNMNGLLAEEGKSNAYVKMRSNYMKEFFRLCNELSLSPQSRVKLANINIGLFAKAIIHDKDVITEAQQGNLKGGSFGFRDLADSWDDEQPIARRTLEDIELMEVSLLTIEPAYIATSVQVRSEGIEQRSRPDEQELKTEYDKAYKKEKSPLNVWVWLMKNKI